MFNKVANYWKHKDRSLSNNDRVRSNVPTRLGPLRSPVEPIASKKMPERHGGVDQNIYLHSARRS